MKNLSLGEILKFKNGKSSINKKSVESGDIPIHGSREIEGYTDESLYEESVIVIARVGEYAGAVHMTDGKCWVTDNAIVARPQNDARITKKFAFYLLKDLNLNRYTGGSAQSLLTQTSLKSIEVTVPDIEKQKKIVSLLDSIDRKIELNRELAGLLEETAHAIYESWFEAYEPYDIPDDQEHPEEFELNPLTDVCDIVLGGTPDRDNADYWGGEIEWATAADITSVDSAVLNNTDENITEKGLEESSTETVKPWSTIVTARGTVGETAITPRKVAVNQSSYALEPHTEYDRFYTYMFIAEATKKFRAEATGSVFDAITKSNLRETQVAIPTIGQKKDFYRHLKPLFKKILSLKQENQVLEELRDYLLPQLLSGEIVIRDEEDSESGENEVGSN